ncbi:MAG: PAS domain-containing protein [Chloroflexi bacterium]|nr:PAS domain-containing protein [Chloroflexota bacterium]
MIPAQIHPLVLPLWLGGLTSLAIAVFAWRRSSRQAKTFGLLMFAVAEWSISYGCELMGVRLDAILNWLKVEYVGIVSAPVFWFLFAAEYAGYRLTSRQRKGLFAVPLIVVALLWTSRWHRLYYADYGLAQIGPYILFSFTPGPGYWVNAVYSYLLLAGGTGLLVRMYRDSARPYRAQIGLVLLGMSLPWVSNLIYRLPWMAAYRIDPTPVAMVLSGVTVAFALLRHRLLDLLPVARSALADALEDAWIVLDARGRIVDLNTKAQEMLGKPLSILKGVTAEEVLAGWFFENGVSLLETLREGKAHVRLEVATAGEEQRHYELRTITLREADGTHSGHLVVLRDITERKQMEHAQERLIGELQEALAQIRTLRGLLPICAHCHRIRDDQGYWHRVEEYIERHSEAHFTHGICPQCMKELYPQWTQDTPQEDAP